jgi:DNA-binding NarL/FixJ family response regulator
LEETFVQRETLRVLVADDHNAMRQCVVGLLSDNFVVIGAVSDGSELAEAAARLKPDVIVSDVQMPRLSGPDAMNNLRAAGINIPFVFISCYQYWVKHMTLNGELCIDKSDLVSNLEDAVLRAATCSEPVNL